MPPPNPPSIASYKKYARKWADYSCYISSALNRAGGVPDSLAATWQEIKINENKDDKDEISPPEEYPVVDNVTNWWICKMQIILASYALQELEHPLIESADRKCGEYKRKLREQGLTNAEILNQMFLAEQKDFKAETAEQRLDRAWSPLSYVGYDNDYDNSMVCIHCKEPHQNEYDCARRLKGTEIYFCGRCYANRCWRDTDTGNVIKKTVK